jgi:hypothetical protein
MLMRHRWIHGRLPLVLGVVALISTACGGGDDATDDTTGDSVGAESTVDQSQEGSVQDAVEPASDGGDSKPASDGGDGGCSVDVSGDVTASWTGPDDISSVGSDYWMSDDELREAYETFALDDDPPFDEARTTGQPIFTILLLNCAGDDGNSVSLYASDASSYADVPEAAGTYPLVGGIDPPPATFSALFSLELGDDSLFRTDDAGGSVDITEWTDDRLSGTFQFGIVETFSDAPRAATVTGTFHFTN